MILAAARVQLNAVRRFASSTAFQDSSVSSSMGVWVWPTTPPATLRGCRCRQRCGRTPRRPSNRSDRPYPCRPRVPLRPRRECSSRWPVRCLVPCRSQPQPCRLVLPLFSPFAIRYTHYIISTFNTIYNNENKSSRSTSESLTDFPQTALQPEREGALGRNSAGRGQCGRRYDPVDELPENLLELLPFLFLWRMSGFLEDDELRVGNQACDCLRRAHGRHPVASPDSHQSRHRYGGKCVLEVVVRRVVLKAPVVRFMAVDARFDGRSRLHRIVVEVVQGNHLGPTGLQVRVVADVPRPVPVEVVPVDLNAVLVPGVLKGKFVIAVVRRSVTEQNCRHVLRIRQRVLEGDKSAI